MLKLNIEDIKNDKYKVFICYAAETCNYMSLVFSKEDGLATYIHNDLYLMFYNSIINKKCIGVHQDTGTDFFDSDLIFFECNSAIKNLILRAECFCEWDGNILPEEICFYRNDKLWLKYISHEELLIIADETISDINFLNLHNINFFLTV